MASVRRRAACARNAASDSASSQPRAPGCCAGLAQTACSRSPAHEVSTRHDRSHLPQEASTKSVALRREAAALVVGQPDALPVIRQNPVRSLKSIRNPRRGSVGGTCRPRRGCRPVHSRAAFPVRRRAVDRGRTVAVLGSWWRGCSERCHWLRRAADVAVMQATDFGNRDDGAGSRGLDWPSVGRVLGEREVSTGPGVVREVVRQDAA